MERKCPNCGSLSAHIGMSMSTCMGWSAYYDEKGNYVNNYPNIHTTEYTCGKCGTRYVISTQHGKSTIKTLSEPKQEDTDKVLSETQTLTVDGSITGTTCISGSTLSSTGIWYNGAINNETLYVNNEPVLASIRKNIEKWAIEQGLDKFDVNKQMVTLMEEVGKLSSCVSRNNKEIIPERLGDIYVALVIMSLHLKINLDKAIEDAYNRIKNSR